MSELSDRIDAEILLADYANIGTDGKLNVIGGGIQIIGFNFEQGLTAAFTIYVGLSCPLPSADTAAVEVLLADAAGDVVHLPGPSGELQALRISHNVQFEQTSIQGIDVPKGALPSTNHMVVAFANGLPLQVGHSYTWRVQVDHDVIASKSMFVPAPPAIPVIG